MKKKDATTAAMEQARRHFQRRELPQAEAIFRRLVTEDSKSPEMWNNLGVVQQMQGRSAEAEVAFRKALELRPNFADAFSNLADALTTQDRFAEAEAAGRRAVELHPDPPSWTNLGTSLSGQQ